MALDRQLVETARQGGFRPPRPRKVDVPLIDVHTHASWPQDEVPAFMEAADLYGVKKVWALTRLEGGLALRDKYPNRIEVAPMLAFDRADRPDDFAEENVAIVERAYEAGCRMMKLWFPPRFNDWVRMKLDDPRLDAVMAKIAELKMAILVHVSDPDRWFEKKYTDKAFYGTKEEQYPALEKRLREFRTIPFICAHMGGDPEHLSHLEQLFADHPNMHIDMSATRWIVRELGRRREAARAFFENHADRILWGTDQVVDDKGEEHRYTVRYWIHQLFWETDVECPLPIDDPDSDGEPLLRGIDLPADVLEKVYYKNAERVLGVPVA